MGPSLLRRFDPQSAYNDVIELSDAGSCAATDKKSLSRPRIRLRKGRKPVKTNQER